MCEMIRISLTAIFFSKTKKNTYRMEVGDPHDFGTTDRWRGNEVRKERFSLKKQFKNRQLLLLLFKSCIVNRLCFDQKPRHDYTYFVTYSSHVVQFTSTWRCLSFRNISSTDIERHYLRLVIIMLRKTQVSSFSPLRNMSTIVT